MPSESPLRTAGQVLREQLAAALDDNTEYDEKELLVIDLACRQADDIERLEALLAEQGPTVVGASGQTRLNPAYAEVRQGRSALTRMLNDIRLPGAEALPNPVKQRAVLTRWHGKGAS